MVHFTYINVKTDMLQWPKESLAIWMHNASAQLHWHEKTQIPYTSSTDDRHEHTTYLMSLRSGWFDYAAQEISDRPLASWSIKQLGKIVKLMGLDRLTLINNLPISTQVHLPCQYESIIQTSRQLMRDEPENFIGIRNLLKHQHGALLCELQALGFVALPSRVIYEFDLRTPPTHKPSHLARDKSLLRKSNLQVLISRETSASQASKLRELYQQIYIRKHSAFNPQYTAQFFYDMVNGGIMQCLQLRDQQEQILAFALLYKVGDTITVPALGYDGEHEQKSLYRLLFAAIHDYTQAHQLLLNYSSGAGDFKRKRGAIAHLEYTLVRAPQRHRFGQNQWLRLAQSWTADIGTNDLIGLGA
jgi:Acetyltransferase (GNAT) domain